MLPGEKRGGHSEDICAVNHEVFQQALNQMASDDDKGGVSPDALREMLADLPTDEAVKQAVQAVICNWCRNYTAAYEVVAALFERPLTPWQSNTVHQLLCMVALRDKRFESVIAHIKELAPERFTVATPKGMELLRLLEIACRATGDEAGAQAALDMQAKLAKDDGRDTPLNRTIRARQARTQGEPWEHLNPALAEFMQHAHREQEVNAQQVRARIMALDEAGRAEMRRRYEAMLSSPAIREADKRAASNELFDVLYQEPYPR
ncbi:MAG: hypothetical protein N2595_03330 [bacterium]|nr:hypothetical protein [bacterium]